MSRIKKVRNKLESIPAQLNRFRPFSLMTIRLTLATAFVPAGWSKLGNVPRTIEFFRSLNIPVPELFAVLVAFLELVGGVLILIGLATRYAAIPLVVVMTMALRLARWDELAGLHSLVEEAEFLYLLLSFALITFGSGAWSLDALLSRNRKERELA